MSTSLAERPTLIRVPPDPSRVRPTRVWLAPALTLVGFDIALLGLAWSPETDIGGLGLLSALHPLYFLGVAVVLGGAALELMSPRARSRWFALQVVAFAVLLHAPTGLIEANPRFPTSYLHVGFADQIASRGELLQGLDARFNWPGFFSGSALVQQATGGAPLDWTLRFFPLLVNLVLVVLIDALGRATHVSLHRRRAAVLLFLVSNWIGQDYFSPQATASVLYLVSLLVVITSLAGPGLRPRWRRLLGAASRRPLPPGRPARRAGLIAVLVLLVAAMITGHQITSGFLTLSLLLLALTGVSSLYAFPVAVGVGTVAWLSFAAEPYWTGHLQKLTGSAGRISTLVQANVTERAASSSVERGLVVHTRLGYSVLLLLAVAISVLVLRRRRELPLPLAVLVLAPWPMLLLQAYGGEMALRVLLVSLPALSLLVASVLLPARRRVRGRHLVALALVLATLVPAFLVARYGNEQYERISSDDLRVLNRLSAQEPGDVLVLTVNSKLPRFWRRVDSVRFASLSATTPSEIVQEAGRREGYDARLVLVGETQDALGVQLEGRHPGWTRVLARRLLATGRFTLEDRSGDTMLLRLVPSPTGAPARDGSLR